MPPGKPKSDPPESDWRDEWFKEKGITEDDDKSFLNSRALADEFVEEARKRRKPADEPAPKKKGLFGSRRGE